MKLTIIGCWGGFPARDGATSAYLIEEDNFAVLVDVGSGALSKLQRYKQVSEIDAVIISHYHHDHIADIGVLQYARLIDYYITGNNMILPIYSHNEDKSKFSSLTHTYTKGIVYDPAKSLEIGPFSITFLKTKHPVPCYGMRVTNGKNTVIYTADTSYKEEWIDFAQDADLLITDCNYYAGQDGSAAGHMTSEEGGKIALGASVKELILSHLPQYGNREQLVDEAKEYYKGIIHLAEEGLVWEK